MSIQDVLKDRRNKKYFEKNEDTLANIKILAEILLPKIIDGKLPLLTEELTKYIDDELAKRPIPKDGIDGKDADIDTILGLILAKIRIPEDGKTPIAGIDFPLPKDGINGINGKDGYIPRKGIDYRDGVDGRNGKDADEEKIINALLNKLSGDIDVKLNEKEEKLLKELEKRIDIIARKIQKSFPKHGGGLTLQNGIIPDEVKSWDVNLIYPNGFYDLDTQLPFSKTIAGITITGIDVSTNDSSLNVAGNLNYADDLLAFTNSVTVSAFDTTSGIKSDLLAVVVGANKHLYLEFTAQPDALITWVTFRIKYKYN